MNLDYKLQALRKSVLARLLSINKIIRLQRNTLSKDSLNYYKQKRKETDQLLSGLVHFKIENATALAEYRLLESRYMNFEISDSKF